jgi:hypothetical protein
MDQLNLSYWNDGIASRINGHRSKFQLPFHFIHHLCKDYEWKVCIWIPYGISNHKVGDSTEQNGCIKVALTNQKYVLIPMATAHRHL